LNARRSIDSSRKPGSSVVFALCALALLLVAAASHAEIAIPPLHARVTDLTNTLDPQQTQQLESELAALEQRKGAQVVVLMLSSTQPETIEQYATRVFDAWKIGRRHVDDGVLVVVAKDDHRVFIETGYGLEGAIPDALASRIIRDYITPKFRGGDFYGGLRDGLGALAKLIDGEPLPPAPKREGSGNGDGGNFGAFLALGFFLAFFFRGVFGRLKMPLRAGANGLLIGAALFLLGGMLVGLGIAGFAIGALVGLLPGSGGAFARSGRWGRWGGWGGGGFGGGGFGGGGFGGGGGFSGGGGMTGGGGASGSW
jgi:uncharacterized protein